MSEPNEIILQVKGLKKHFPLRSTGFRRQTIGEIKAVEDVTFELHTGEALGVVGESGCGKTTLGRCIVRIYNPTAGEILLGLGNRNPGTGHQQCGAEGDSTREDGHVKEGSCNRHATLRGARGSRHKSPIAWR